MQVVALNSVQIDTDIFWRKVAFFLDYRLPLVQNVRKVKNPIATESQVIMGYPLLPL